MKKILCLIALVLVFSTSVPLVFAQQDPPVIVGGGGRPVGIEETSRKTRNESLSLGAALKVQVVLTLIRAGVIG